MLLTFLCILVKNTQYGGGYRYFGDYMIFL